LLNDYFLPFFILLGKTSFIDKLLKSPDAQKLAEIFLKSDAEKDEIAKAGSELFLKR